MLGVRGLSDVYKLPSFMRPNKIHVNKIISKIYPLPGISAGQRLGRIKSFNK